MSIPRPRRDAVAALVALSLVGACGPRSEPRDDAKAGSARTDAGPPAEAAPSTDAAAGAKPPSSSAKPPSSSAPPASSWLGVTIDPSVRFERTVRVSSKRDAAYAAEIQVPSGWHVVNLGNGMYDETLAVLVTPIERSALVIVFAYEPGVWDERLVNQGTERWLTVSGGVTRIDGWDAPIPLEIGPPRTPGTRVLGRGVLKKGPADLWQIRRRFPSPTSGKHALVATAALTQSAPPERRAELLACLATFAPSPDPP